jgi:rRNA maturation protein Nop10
VGLVSATCPACGQATYVSLPPGRSFVGTERDASAREGLVEETTTCSHCGRAFPFVHGPA